MEGRYHCGCVLWLQQSWFYILTLQLLCCVHLCSCVKTWQNSKSCSYVFIFTQKYTLQYTRIMGLQFSWYHMMQHRFRLRVITQWILQNWQVKLGPGAWITRKHSNMATHEDVIKWKHFPRYWPFVRGTHWSSVNSLHRGQWRGDFMFSLICAWINHWVNNRKAGDLRRQHAHYDVIVMDRLAASCQPIRGHVWKSLLTNMGFTKFFFLNTVKPLIWDAP